MKFDKDRQLHVAPYINNLWTPIHETSQFVIDSELFIPIMKKFAKKTYQKMIPTHVVINGTNRMIPDIKEIPPTPANAALIA